MIAADSKGSNARLRSLLAMVLAILWLLQGCGGGGGGSAVEGDDEPSTPEPISPYISNSGTLWHDEDTGVLWLLSPDDARLVKLDADSLEQLSWFALDEKPIAMTAAADYLVIALANGLQRFALSSESFSPVIRIPCGDPHAVVTDEAGGNAWLSCINDDLLVAVNFTGAGQLRLLELQTPAGLSLVDDQLYISQFVGGDVWSIELETISALPVWGENAPVPAAPVPALYRTGTDERHSVSQFTHVSADPETGQLVGVYQRVENSGDRSRVPEQGGYGSTFDGQPRIEPRLVAACGDRYARFDGGLRVFSGPEDLAMADGLLWVVHQYTQNVSVLRCPPEGANDQWPQNGTAAELQLVAHFSASAGARGIALAADGRTAWIDNSFDYSVSKLFLTQDMLATGDAFASPQLSRVRETGELSLSARARRGRTLFFDATNTHLTPSGIVTCATCHPKAGSDGLEWFLHTTEIPRKFRNTSPAWAARSSAAPFHWDGDFGDAGQLTRVTVRGLMEGDALLVDTSAIAAYMNETPAPMPVSIPPWQSGQLTQGQELFEARCSACHAGALFTDNMKHRVVPDSQDPDGVMTSVDTPGLTGLRSTAPYLHDGRATQLSDVLLLHNRQDTHGQVSDLDDKGIQNLLLYLRSL